MNMMYDETKKYKDVPVDNQVFTYLAKFDNSDSEKLIMLLANLSMPKMCYSWSSSDDFNSLLNKYKIDVSEFEKETIGVESSVKDEIANTLFNLIETKQYKKRNLIKELRNKYPSVNAGIIHRMIKKFLSLRILEIDRTYKTKQYVIKGKYCTR
jgi:hypothetical protein